MSKLEIYLKSGHTVKVECDYFEFNYDSTTLEYTGYSFKGLKNIKTVSIVPSQISAYVVLE